MPYSTPSSTPKQISLFLSTIAAVSVLVTILNTLFFDFPGLEGLFGLSLAGFKRSYFWQFFTYPFLLENDGAGLTASYAFYLGFNLYMLWILCSIILDHIGSFRFFFFSLICTLIAGGAGLLGVLLTGHDQILTGQIPLISSLLTLWAVLNPAAILLIFYIFPIKVKTLALGALAYLISTSIWHLNWVLLLFYIAGPIFAYFFGLSMKKRPFEVLKNHFNSFFNKGSKNEKIIDFHTGKPKRVFTKS